MLDWLVPGNADQAAQIAMLAMFVLFASLVVVAAAEILISLARHDPPRR